MGFHKLHKLRSKRETRHFLSVLQSNDAQTQARKDDGEVKSFPNNADTRVLNGSAARATEWGLGGSPEEVSTCFQRTGIAEHGEQRGLLKHASGRTFGHEDLTAEVSALGLR